MLFTPGHAPLWVHFLTDTFSLLIPAWYYSRIYKKVNSSESSVSQKTILLIGAAAGALIGSRLIAALERPELFFNPPHWMYYYAVKTVAGGIAGGILGIEIVKKFLKIKTSVGDIMVGPIALGVIIGRIGCFLVGVRDQTVGLVSSLPWAMDQGDGLLRHPTSLYEILVVGFLWIGLSLFMKKRSDLVGSGIFFRLFAVGYFGFRFFVEFIKPVHPLIGGLTAIQWTSAIVVLGYGVSLLRLMRKV